MSHEDIKLPEVFNDVKPLDHSDDENAEWVVAEVRRETEVFDTNADDPVLQWDREFIDVSSSIESITLTVGEARILYEWLGRALPGSP